MEKIKISICLTVKNEEKYIGNLLTSLLNQSKKAGEIVIVDGGSDDKTLQIIRHFAKKEKSIKLLKAPSSTIAQARNLGIEIAKGEIIATTDAGCIASKNWIKNISHPFKYKNVGLVAGYYTMPFKTSLQEAGIAYLGIPPQRYDSHTFLPSARSVAFKKEVWEQIGGFNEKLERGGEDTQFFYDCVKSSVKIVRVEEAIVEWSEIKDMNLKDISNKFFVYAKGDGQAKIWWHPSKQLSSHNIKISLVFIRYIVGFFVVIACLYSYLSPFIPVILVILYTFWPIWKWRDVVKNPKTLIYLPLLQYISDIQVMKGFLAGMLTK